MSLCIEANSLNANRETYGNRRQCGAFTPDRNTRIGRTFAYDGRHEIDDHGRRKRLGLRRLDAAFVFALGVIPRRRQTAAVQGAFGEEFSKQKAAEWQVMTHRTDRNLEKLGPRPPHFQRSESTAIEHRHHLLVRNSVRWSAAPRLLGLSLLFFPLMANSITALAQANYAVHFEMEKPNYLLGEPIFCRFVIRNTGSKIFALRYRTPSRSLAADHEQEPRFLVTDSRGARLSDPGPRPCGSPQGTVVYGYVTLPPGQVHSERWLLNQWAQFAVPGRYHVRAERRLALLQPDPQTGKFGEKPAAFALAIDELDMTVVRSTRAQVEAAFHPYLAAIGNPKDPNPAEAVVVLTSLPQPFFLEPLVMMAHAGKPDRWDRRDALDGLARLNTPASWKAILDLFRGADTSASSGSKGAAERAENPLRSYALLLLAEKGDPAFVPALVEILANCAEPTRGDILRALGFFHDPRAYQSLYDNLHSAQVTDRMNSILGLKNLGAKEVIPALLAALNDPEVQVRQVANFALAGLTSHQVAVSANPTREESARVASNWDAWWREHAGTFSPPRPAACHDW